MLSYLPGGDQVPDVAPPCVGEKKIGSVHLTERLNTLFAIVTTGIDGLNDLRIIENQSGFQKIDFPSLPVFPPLVLVP